MIGSDGNTYGPVDLPTLKDWVKEGRIGPNSRIKDPVTGSFVRAADLAELAADIDASSRPAPAPQETQVAAKPVQPTRGPDPYSSPYSSQSHAMVPGGSTTLQKSNRSKIAAGLLAFFLGTLGIHRFYLGHTGTGIAMLLITVLTFGFGAIVTGIWALIDMILIFTGSLRDVNGLELAD